MVQSIVVSGWFELLVISLLQKFPNILDQQIIECFDVVFEDGFGLHVGANVAIVNAVKRIEFYGIAFEMSGQKG